MRAEGTRVRSRLRRTLAHLSVGLATAAACTPSAPAPSPGPPPGAAPAGPAPGPPPPQTESVIVVEWNDVLHFAARVPPYTPYAAGETELNDVPLLPYSGGGGVARLPLSVYLAADPRAVTLPTNNLDYPTRSPGPNISLRSQVALQLFDRDPSEEVGHIFLEAQYLNPQNDGQFRAQISTPADTYLGRAYNPFMDLMPFAPTTPYAPAALKLDNIVAANFWPEGQATVAGPGSVPYPSIKSLRLLTTGLCSTSTGQTNITTQISNGIQSSLLSKACQPGHTLLKVNYVDASSVLYHNEIVTDSSDVRGGFVVQGMATLYDDGACSLAGIGSCSPWPIKFTAFYQYELQDGRLAITSAIPSALPGETNPPILAYDGTKILCSGSTLFGASGFADALRSALQNDVPKQFYQSSQAQQVVPPPFTYCGTPAGLPDNSRCAPQDAGASGEPTCDPTTLICHDQFDCDLTDTDNPCRGAETLFGLAVGNGETILNLNALDTASTLAATVKDPSNWQCVPQGPNVCSSNATAPATGRCQFILRAKRLNVGPTEIELVWFDDWTDFTNPTLGVFAASFYDEGNAPTLANYSAYKQLCSRLPDGVFSLDGLPNSAPQNYTYRGWGNYHLTETGVCQQATPPAPPLCGCKNVSGVASGSSCPCGSNCVDGRCTNICNVDSDCPPLRNGTIMLCDAAIHRCVYAGPCCDDNTCAAAMGLPPGCPPGAPLPYESCGRGVPREGYPRVCVLNGHCSSK